MLAAATVGDFTSLTFSPLILPGHKNVLINGKPAAWPGLTKTPPHHHGKPVLVGIVAPAPFPRPNILVNGLPMRAEGDFVTCGETIIAFNFNVRVGV